MSRIDEKEFWAGRLQSSNFLFQSVFNVAPDSWNKIEKNHKRVIMEHIDIKNDSILDIGCAYGRPYINEMKNYVGIDLSPEFIEVAQKEFPDKQFLSVRMEDYKPKEKFDWGICSSIKRMIIRENGIDDWNIKEEHLKTICKKILILEYTEAIEDSYVATEIIEGY